MSNRFSVKILYVVLSTDLSKNKKYVLSLDNEAIKLPTLECSNENIAQLDSEVIKYLKDMVCVNELEMLPQIICINDKFIPNMEKDTVYIVYGFVLTLTSSLNNVFWKEFDFLQPNEHSNLILKVVQNLV